MKEQIDKLRSDKRTIKIFEIVFLYLSSFFLAMVLYQACSDNLEENEKKIIFYAIIFVVLIYDTIVIVNFCSYRENITKIDKQIKKLEKKLKVKDKIIDKFDLGYNYVTKIKCIDKDKLPKNKIKLVDKYDAKLYAQLISDDEIRVFIEEEDGEITELEIFEDFTKFDKMFKQKK